jgi:hypothetical protein
MLKISSHFFFRENPSIFKKISCFHMIDGSGKRLRKWEALFPLLLLKWEATEAISSFPSISQMVLKAIYSASERSLRVS